MSKATDTPTTSRRRLLAGSAAGTITAAVGLSVKAAPVFIPATSPDHPDAALIAACMVFMTASEAVNRKLAEPCDSIDWNADAEFLAEDNAFERVLTFRAKTLVGAKAKARAIIATLEHDVPQCPGETVEDVADFTQLSGWNLAHDILLLGAA